MSASVRAPCFLPPSPCRLILENLLKYGWRLNFLSYVNRSLAGRGNLPLVLSFPALVALSLLALAAERLGLICIRAEHKVGHTRRQTDRQRPHGGDVGGCWRRRGVNCRAC